MPSAARVSKPRTKMGSTVHHGFSWVEGWLESYSSLAEEKKANCGLVFDPQVPVFPWMTLQRLPSIISRIGGTDQEPHVVLLQTDVLRRR